MKTRTAHVSLFTSVALGLVVALAGTALAQAGSSNLGTWKLDLAKSTFAAGTAPKSGTFTNTVAGAGIKTVSDTVRADGTAIHSEYTMVYDGKDYPITGPSLNGDVSAGTRIDANTVKFIYKKDGKVTVTTTNVASSDGKTYTITAKGTNTLGQTVNSVAVYDKQQAPDSFIGTWTLNVAKSTYEPATSAPKSSLVKLEAIAGGGMKTTADGVDGQGKPVHTEVTTLFDGKASEVKGAPDANTTRVYKRIDSRTYEFVTSVNGKVTTTSRSVSSADGKTRTTTTTGKNAQGVTVKVVAVYERQ